MGPQHRETNGIWCRPKKTKRSGRAFHIPLSITDTIELDRWSETQIMFKASRWKSPILRHREDLYLYSPKGIPYNPTSLRARWIRWLKRTADGEELCRLWKIWTAEKTKKYDWEIDPLDVKVSDNSRASRHWYSPRRTFAYEVEQISNDIGMSRQMVEHYMRFKDQMAVGADGRRD